MHGHVPLDEFLDQISAFLGTYYVALSVMNAVAALYLWQSGKSRTLGRLGGLEITTALVWIIVAIGFLLISPIAYSLNPRLAELISIPSGVRAFADRRMDPVTYTVGTFAGLTILFVGRRFFSKPWVAWTGLNMSLLLMGFSVTDPDFAAVVTKPDNVPIVGLVFLLGFFTWLATNKAVQNDERAARGEPPLESLDSEKVLVWPDLVYTELICMVALTALMLLWAIGLQAPLEAPANAMNTPNPSKAPWYFLGLQEMLVYYDPWMAGVVLPSMVIFGLMAIPFLDFNKQGNGYYTISQRPFAYVTFQFGFLVLWITLIVMGTFLRGPNWNFFGFYETWDAHKVEALNNVDLSHYFWIDFLHREMPKAAEDAVLLSKVFWVIYRELPGILFIAAYFTIIPPALVLASKLFRSMYVKMGFLRYMLMSNLLLTMALLPLKMVLRWTIHFKYFIAIPEYLLNF